MWDVRYFEFQEAGFVIRRSMKVVVSPYWDKVYLTGARFFEDLRTQVGDEIFFAFLKDYYTQMEGKRATSADFFRIFRANTAADITELLTKYFKNTY